MYRRLESVRFSVPHTEGCSEVGINSQVDIRSQCDCEDFAEMIAGMQFVLRDRQ
jgi:hypothetical protein